MPATNGQLLSHYRLSEKIGEGGMGVVWRAEDTVLRREVALKFLPEGFAHDAGMLGRFKREARFLATLNHANIAAIHGLEEADGELFLVLELVPGESLAGRVKRGPLPIEEVLKIGTEVAQALEAAHAKGVVHRDLKPANIHLTPEGQVKVLDFGLAKAFRHESPTSRVSQQATLTVATAEQAIIGTMPYMSPEQASGEPLDGRTDIWAFGCVLYELLTGRRAFHGDTVSSMLAAIHGRDPDWQQLPPRTPPRVRELLRACLAKDPAARLDAIADARIEIVAALADYRGRRSPWVLPAVSAALLLVVLGGYLVWKGSGNGASVPRLTDANRVTSDMRNREQFPSWSPDGRTLAYQSNGDIWLQQVGLGQPINRTSDNPRMWDALPAWSPDGQRIAFLSGRGDGGVFIMPALGGPARKFCDAGMGRPQWSRDGQRIAYTTARPDGVSSPQGAYIEIRGVTDATREHFSVGKGAIDLAWSPNGEMIAYVDGINRNDDLSNVRVLKLSTGTSFAVTDGNNVNWSPSWSADSRWLYFTRNGDLWRARVALDDTTMKVEQQVAAGLGIESLALAPDGRRLAYAVTTSVGNLWRIPILTRRAATWADADQVTFVEGKVNTARAAPDRRSLLISLDSRGGTSLFRLALEPGARLERLTDDPGADFAPALSPDGESIVFYSTRSGNRDVWVMPSHGGPARQLTRDAGNDWYPVWSPGGDSIAWTGRDRLWRCDVESCEPELVTDQVGGYPDWSPDGQWLATARWIVPVEGGTPEPLTASAGNGGSQARWSADGTTVFVLRRHGVWAVDVKERTERPLTDLRGRPGRFSPFALATDGEFVYFGWIEPRGDIWVAEFSD